MIASGLSNFGDALQRAFDLLNIHRLQTGIDNYGQGRNPFYLEPAAIVAITDGGHSIESLDVWDGNGNMKCAIVTNAIIIRVLRVSYVERS